VLDEPYQEVGEIKSTIPTTLANVSAQNTDIIRLYEGSTLAETHKYKQIYDRNASAETHRQIY
jgi:hypothetical protein